MDCEERNDVNVMSVSKNGEEKVDSHKLWTVSGICYKGVRNRIGRIVDIPDLLQNEVEEELGKHLSSNLPFLFDQLMNILSAFHRLDLFLTFHCF
jgi:hypothetical protein